MARYFNAQIGVCRIQCKRFIDIHEHSARSI